MLLDGLSALSNDILDKDVIYGLLLVLSGILMDKNGEPNCTLVDCYYVLELLLGKCISLTHLLLKGFNLL